MCNNSWIISTLPEPAQAHILTVIKAIDLNGSAKTLNSLSSAFSLFLRPEN